MPWEDQQNVYYTQKVFAGLAQLLFFLELYSGIKWLFNS